MQQTLASCWRGFVARDRRLSSCLASAAEQLLDTEGEECSEAKVEGFFTRFVLQNESIAGLDDGPRGGVVDGCGQIDFDRQLSFAGRPPEDVETTWWHTGYSTCEAAYTATTGGSRGNSAAGDRHGS